MAKKLDSISTKKPGKETKETPEAPKVVEEIKKAPESEAVALTPEAVTTPVEKEPEVKEENDSYESLFPEPTVSISKPPALILWALLLVGSIIVAILGYKTVNGRLDTWLSASPNTTSTPSPTSTPTATETPSPSPTIEATATPSISPTATPITTPQATATPTTVSAKNVTLRILNGSTKNGAASTAKTTVEKAGFTVRTIGNAAKQTYATTMVYYQKNRKAEAELVQKSLTGYSVTIEESSLASPDMVLIVIGAK